MRDWGMLGSALIVGILAIGAARQNASKSLDAILDDEGDYHLEQHPDPQCRRNWRNDDLSLDDKRATETKIVYEAKRFLGRSYLYGGTGDKGLDCSALVNRIYARFGYDLPRTASEQFQVGISVEQSQLRRGDLVFFHPQPNKKRSISHVGIYIGDDEMLHASSGRNKVLVDKLSSKYYKKRFAGGRRFLPLPPGRYSSAGGLAKEGMLFSSRGQARRRLGRAGPCTERDY